MAIAPPALTSAIIAAGAGTVSGINLPSLASAVSRSIVSWLPNVTAQGFAVGVAGVGTATGKMFLAGAGGPVVTAGLQAAGVNGILAPQIGNAVGNGILTVFNSSWQYQGVVVAVGTGADTTSIRLSNPGPLIALLNDNFPGSGITGILAGQLATGIGNGVANLISQGFGIGGVTGSVSPTAASGVSVSVTF